MEIKRNDLKNLCSILNILKSEPRLLILCSLVDGKKTVTEICNIVNIGNQSAISQHLKILRDFGYISSKKNGKYHFYSIANQDVIKIIQFFKKEFCGG